MKVTVKFSPYLTTLTKADQIAIDLNESAHLSDLLRVLTTLYGEALMDLLYASDNDSIDVWASAIVEGQAISLPPVPESDVRLKEGSVVVLMAPASGS